MQQLKLMLSHRGAAVEHRERRLQPFGLACLRRTPSEQVEEEAAGGVLGKASSVARPSTGALEPEQTEMSVIRDTKDAVRGATLVSQCQHYCN